MSSVATLQTRPQKRPSKAKKPYMKPLVEEIAGKPYSRLVIDERTLAEFEKRVTECKRVIDYRIDKKISEAKTVGLDYDDLNQAALEGILKTMISHDPERAGFRTWAGHKIRGEITKRINEAYRQRGTHNRYVWIVKGYDEALRIYNGLQSGFPKTGVGFEVLEELRQGKKTEEQVKEERQMALAKLNRRRDCFLDDRIGSGREDGESSTIMTLVERNIAEEWEEPDIEGEIL